MLATDLEPLLPYEVYDNSALQQIGSQPIYCPLLDSLSVLGVLSLAHDDLHLGVVSLASRLACEEGNTVEAVRDELAPTVAGHDLPLAVQAEAEDEAQSEANAPDERQHLDHQEENVVQVSKHENTLLKGIASANLGRCSTTCTTQLPSSDHE